MAFTDSGPNTQTLFVANLNSCPIYFVCFYAPPETKFATLGPIEVSKQLACAPKARYPDAMMLLALAHPAAAINLPEFPGAS